MALLTTLVRFSPSLLDSVSDYDGWRLAVGEIPIEGNEAVARLSLPKYHYAGSFLEQTTVDVLTKAAQGGNHSFDVHVPANHPDVSYPKAHTKHDDCYFYTSEEVEDMSSRLNQIDFLSAFFKENVTVALASYARTWALNLVCFYDAASKMGQAVMSYR